MKFKELEGFAFDKESKELGAIASIDFQKQTMKILTDNEVVVVARLEDVVLLENLGYMGEEGIINHDVLKTVDGRLFEIELQEDEKSFVLHSIDSKLNRNDEGEATSTPLANLSSLGRYLSLVGNIFELEPEEDLINFNIVIVRTSIDGEFGYAYACNNAEKEEIDLIKVLFIGHHLLEEESYNRETITHEEYLEYLEDGTLKEVTPNELMNYVTGATFGQGKSILLGSQERGIRVSSLESDDDIGDEPEEEEDDCDCSDCRQSRGEVNYCAECGEEEDECDCKGW